MAKARAKPNQLLLVDAELLHTNQDGLSSQVINVAKVVHRSPFRYPGGKTWLVPHIGTWLRVLPERPCMLVEPFAGGAIVGLSALFDGLVDRLLLVERDEDVSSVWRVLLNGKAVRLADDIAEFQPSERNVRELLSQKPVSLYERAFTTLVRNRMQRGGILAPGASLMKSGENGRGLASRWYPETLRRRILAIHDIRRRITFVQGDGIEVLTEFAASNDTAFFIDPPYTVAGRRLYKYGDVDHERLFMAASTLTGPFVMSYDIAEPIRSLARKYTFETAEVPMKNTHHAVMRELLISKDLTWYTSKRASGLTKLHGDSALELAQ